MLHLLWRATAAGVVSADLGAYRLTVRIADTTLGTANFLVFRVKGKDDPGALISSGTEASVGAAMRAAEGVAARWAGTTNELDTKDPS